jgi:uncharacterized membrane protein
VHLLLEVFLKKELLLFGNFSIHKYSYQSANTPLMISTEHFHPMIVHFPVALIMVGFLAETLALVIKKEPCLTKTGYYLLILGALSAFAAYLTGQFFTGEMSGAAGEVREQHELFALITMLSMVVNAVFRSFLLIKHKETALLRWTSYILYLGSAILVSVTGFLGGTLVYSYMMPL